MTNPQLDSLQFDPLLEKQLKRIDCIINGSPLHFDEISPSVYTRTPNSPKNPPEIKPGLTFGFIIEREKLCREIERRLTHSFGYDGNSDMRQCVKLSREDDDLFFPDDQLADYLDLKDELKRREHNSALKNYWDHLRGRSI